MTQTEWTFFEAILEVIRTTGLLGAAILVIVGWLSGRIVRGSDLEAERKAHEKTREELERERRNSERWISVALRGRQGFEEVTSMTEKVLPRVEEPR